MTGKSPIVAPAEMRRTPRMVASVCFAAYLGTYLVLSVIGAYVPGEWNLTGVKRWTWAPAFFADQKGRFRKPVWYFFQPPWQLDRQFCHNDWTGESGPRHHAWANEQ